MICVIGDIILLVLELLKCLIIISVMSVNKFSFCFVANYSVYY